MAIDRLTRIDGDLDYLITVDIFNEGIDIPEINQIVMLRPTQSVIVFVQQFGRGLRKENNKDYVVILDFIGNYDNNFFIPIALSGDKTYNKNTIKEFLIEGTSSLPGASTIDFDEISKERIYQSINKQNFSTIKHLQEQYSHLKNKIGKTPKLIDFINYNSIEPQVIFDHKDFSNYSLFLERVEKKNHIPLSTYENQVLTFFTLEFSNGMRLEEIYLIESLMKNNCSISMERYKEICKDKNIERSLKRIFTLEFFVKTDIKKYGSIPIIDFSDYKVSFNSKIYKSIMTNSVFKDHIQQVIYLAKLNYANKYTNTIKSSNMVLFEKYTKKDMCRLFNWDNDEKGTVYGYRFKHNTFPIYVTYHKKEDISDSINYKDYFINPQIFPGRQNLVEPLIQRMFVSLRKVK
ncbi:DUF3427 domain-containing protein [Globicatella sulfidifaciens]|uniref:DUF3427 domain-containing protein n=1 Tax=Globicatella sulfidifaciens TaxID=136093 RepID=A0A7X8C2F2_9LACT|nr:DUF3427 domain-containing protein [Globicatella sulfidifaciens]NLJ17569.1 DUF3427 domain-containing protein [Globicatella sulfidifaciens]